MRANANTKEGGNIILILVGVVAILFLIGFFRSAPAFWDTVNYKTVLRLPCGLTVKHPSFGRDEKAVFPLTVDGYINGCGWDPVNGSAGVAQIFDGKGLPLSVPTDMNIQAPSGESPYFFSAAITLITPPSTDSGQILLKSTTGLLYPILVSF